MSFISFVVNPHVFFSDLSSFQSPFFDGKMAKWYHFSCFFEKQKPKAVADIGHFESLRFEDQEKIRAKIGGK